MTEAAFVAGATGYTGREVVRALVARGCRTVAHVRPGSRSAERLVPMLEQIGTVVERCPWEANAIEAALARHGVTHVFALIGTTKRRGREASRAGRPEESYETVDYGLSRMLLDATKAFARSSGTAPVFVYLSSMGVREGVKNPYLAVRARTEAEIEASGLPYLIARPSFITGPDRDESRPGERVGAAVTDAALSAARMLGARRLSDRYRSIRAGELAAALVALALDEKAHRTVVEADRLRHKAATG